MLKTKQNRVRLGHVSHQENSCLYIFPLQGTGRQGVFVHENKGARGPGGSLGVPGSQSDLGAVVLELAGKHPPI